MVLGSERKTVQSPIIRYAQEIGWEYVSPEDAIRLRRGETSPIFWDVLIQKLQLINPGLVDSLKAEEIARQLVRILPNIEGNMQTWEYLNGLRTVFVETENRERNVRLLDYENVKRNAFHVSDEFSFSNGMHQNRPDVLFLVNGIPIIDVETKAADELNGIEKALTQIRRYHNEIPELFALMQIFGLTHLVKFYYGATWNTLSRNLFNWKEESVGKDFETLVKTFIQPERVIRVLRDFILFVRKDDELSKVIMRPHQMRAVERCLVRAHDPAKRRGLIWHTQGSGKTYTMILLAKRLIEDPVFENPTVLMLVDRNELEAQLFGNLASTCGLGHVCVAESKRHLRDLLRNDTRGLIISMIHKFEGIPEGVNRRENIFVLVDEAHRTTGSDLGNYLMGALPNATYFGFTGTPIDKTSYGKGTFKVFGVDDAPEGYLDKYSIAESIENGTTVPLYYALAPNELRVDRETLEREFLDLAVAEGVSDIEDLNKILEHAVRLKNMLKNRGRVQKVAEYVASHFKNYVEPMGFKAFLVGVDRKACCLLKEELDKHLPPEYSKVVISPFYNDPPEMKKYHLSEEEEKLVRKLFIKPDELPKILIVTGKLLTGYDAPILYCMYLDKPMRDHVLLQTIARVNRPYESGGEVCKPGGFILDFVGIFENLEKALAFDSKDISRVAQDIDILKRRFAQMLEEAKDKYLSVLKGESADKVVESVIEFFRDEGRRQEFYQFFKELQDLYEIISPDQFLRNYLYDYRKLADLYDLLKATFESGKPTLYDLARKTEKLVEEYTKTGLIRETVEVYEINSDTLNAIARSVKPNPIKVFNLLKSIEQKVKDEGYYRPYLFSIGDMAETIAEMFKQKQIATEDALEELKRLVEEINKARNEQAKKGLSSDGFTVYWMIKRAGIRKEMAEKLALSVEQAMSENPHWRTDSSQQREVRKRLYETLAESGYKDITSLVKEIMNIIARKR